MNQTQLDGVTKARLAANIALAKSGAVLYTSDAAYIAKVCADANLQALPDRAADSYAAQHAGKTITGLELELVAAVNAAAAQYAASNQPEPIVTVAGVPAKVTMRQARLALLAGGYLAGVAAAIASLPSPQKEQATIEWEYSQYVERQRPFVLQLGGALGLNTAQLDALFVAAALL
jgi:hypothetical protein